MGTRSGQNCLSSTFLNTQRLPDWPTAQKRPLYLAPTYSSLLTSAIVILGGFTSIFMLVSLFIKEKLYIGEATVATICGVVFGPHAANLINPLTWGNTDQITLEFSRIVLVVQCFAVGVELPKAYMERHWRSVVFLLVPVMTFGWLITSLFIWWMIEPLSWLESLVVAACVTATDPVLASSVVGKGKFAKRVPKHLRDILSAESGCNDGMAFPFIYLALYLVRYDLNASHTIYHWFCFTVLYECIFGAFYGVMVGLIGRHAIRLAERKGIIDRESFLVFYFVLALFCAGSGSLLGMDDLLVGFAAGVGFSNDGWFSERTEESHVSNVIDLLINLAYFVYFGTIIPWDQYNAPDHGITPWRLVVIAIMVIFFRRIPAMLLFKSFIPDIKTWREALFAGHFGPIGVGAIFVAILAIAELETEETTPLAHLPPPGSREYELIYLVWPIVSFLVITSILVHGSSIAVFTLGKRINTLTLTLSYTVDNEKGPAWMQRLPRIGPSGSKSLSRASSFSDADEKLDILPGTLPGPGGFPKAFLRRQKDEEYEAKTDSRPSSQKPGRRRKKKNWDSEMGPGGPISASAIMPAPRSDSNLPNLESGSETLFEKSGEPSPEAPLKSPESSPERGGRRSRSMSPGGRAPPRRSETEVEAYEEGHQVVIEDEDGNVLETFDARGKSDEAKAAEIEAVRKRLGNDQSGKYVKHRHESRTQDEGEEFEQPAGGSAEPAEPPEKSLKHRFANWKGFGRTKDEGAGESSRKEKPEHIKRRGAAHAYQFGNTIIVEDEDGEVIKKYTIPPAEGDRRRTYGQDQLRQGMQRMGTWVGLGRPDNATGPEVPTTGEGGADVAKEGGDDRDADKKPGQTAKKLEKPKRRNSDDESQDDGLRMTISRTQRYGLTGLQKPGVGESERPSLTTSSGRRLSTRDFLMQMQQLDPKKKLQQVDESDAPEEVKRELKQKVEKEYAGDRRGSRPTSDRPDGDYFSAPHRPQAPRAQTSESIETIEEEIPTHDVRSSLVRHGKGQTAAEARRKRLATINSNEE